MKLFIFNDEKSYGILCRRSRRKIALQGLYLKNKNFLEFFGIFFFIIILTQFHSFFSTNRKKSYNIFNSFLELYTCGIWVI